MYWKVRLKVSERQTWVNLHVTYRLGACVGPFRLVVTHKCRGSNTVSNEALLTVLSSREGARMGRADVSRMGHLERDIYPLPRQWCRSVAKFQFSRLPMGYHVLCQTPGFER